MSMCDPVTARKMEKDCKILRDLISTYTHSGPEARVREAGSLTRDAAESEPAPLKLRKPTGHLDHWEVCTGDGEDAHTVCLLFSWHTLALFLETNVAVNDGI